MTYKEELYTVLNCIQLGKFENIEFIKDLYEDEKYIN